MNIRLAVIALVMSLAAQKAVEADFITFAFTGSINGVGTNLANDFLIGQTVTGYYTFESSTVGQPYSPGGVLEPSAAHYLGALRTLDATIGNYHVSLGTGEQRILVFNDEVRAAGLFQDRYLVDAFQPTGANVNSLPVYAFNLYLQDNSATAFSDKSLPLFPPDLNLFGTRSGFVDFANGQTPDLHRVSFSLNSITAVPEPSSFSLISVGFAAIAWTTRRKRRR